MQKSLIVLILLCFVNPLRADFFVAKDTLLSATDTVTTYLLDFPEGNLLEARAGVSPGRGIIIKIINEYFLPAGPVDVKMVLRDAPDGLITGPDTSVWLRSDSLGIAMFYPPVLPKPGIYSWSVFLPDRTQTEESLIEVHVREKNWVLMLCIGLFGGLSLFILGMSMMSEGMQNSAGNRMRTILGKLTANRFMALGMGALVTMIIQSSSATNVMLVSFVNSKLMRFRQTIGIMLGAALGTTITAQIIAFKITDYALLFVAVGLLIQMAGKNSPYRELGKAILGFGILFFGMHVMSDSMAPLRSYSPFLDMVVRLENPVAGILAGAILTALIQSSSAFIGILIILAMQGLLTIGAAVPLIIGANVGTAITAVLASIGATREAKQVALAHTLFKLIGAGIAVFFIPALARIVVDFGGQHEDTGNLMQIIASPRQIANTHTLFNVILCILFLPVTRLFALLVEKIFPATEEPVQSFSVMYLDTGLINTPALALEATRKELLRMMRKVYGMTETILSPFLNHSAAGLSDMDKAEEEVDYLRDRISDFLLQITRNEIPPEINEEAYIMMNAIREFEEIADVLSGPLKAKALSWCENEFSFSVTGRDELVRYHQHTLSILEQAINVYRDFNPEKARKLKTRYDEYREEYFELERQHYARLQAENEATLSSSKTHLEIITLLRVISSHATNTSRILIHQYQLKNRSGK